MTQGVLLVRAEQDHSPLEIALRERGFSVYKHSLVNVHSVKQDVAPLVAENWDGIVVVSPNAARCMHELCESSHWPTARRGLFTVGPGTAKTLAEYVASPVSWPSKGHDSESLLGLSDFKEVKGERWLIITGKNGRRHIEDTLTERGAQVTVAEVYERIPKLSKEAQVATEVFNQVQRVAITSREQASLLCATLGEQKAHEWARSCHWVVPSERVMEPLKSLDIPRKNIHFAKSAVVEDVVATMTSIKNEKLKPTADHADEEPALNTKENPTTDAKASAKVSIWAVLMFIVLFLCVGTLAAGGWWLWKQQDLIQAKNQEEIAQVRNTLSEAQRRDANFEARLEARLQDQVSGDLEQMASEQASEFTRLQDMQEAQSARIREQMAQQDRELARLSQRLRETEERNSHQWLAHEAYDRIVSATQRLAIDGSPDIAIQLLQQADELLAEEADRFQTIRMQLERDIEYLQSLPRLDLSGTIVTLQTLQQQISELPLRSTSFGDEEVAEEEVTSDISNWRSNLANAWQAFSDDLIRIQKTSDLPVRLDQEQRLSLNSRLEMQLQLAQQAAVRGDQTLFDTAINESFQLISEYFDIEVPETENVLAILSSLKEVSVQTDYPSSLLSRAMLREYISALESAPVRAEE
ncbi:MULTISPECIES: uroporphyrinogen-III C-methyltransferase [Gammaproteobacteria]|uniref:uroporphyrinogen-III C-methyltransferase n=1 Tax=Gammaproteobacteria TaxID=1236 RepID=UPI000DCF86E3|nr:MULTISPECIES: uroporphyrinogen-III C-methyltransferase [Gammaproteobacteria]RTE85965.1 uroporphyrinogen-III synthase [Aliidiomarina sp. B3213]TCZ90036.1 uroporphyrinogen-III synthase [Lysobacter sp. N42]